MDVDIVLKAVVPASPERVFAGFVEAAEHAAMTGAPATSEPRVGGRFTAWDGYIEGTYVELVPAKRVVARWRTSEFPAESADSLLVIKLEGDAASTTISLVHSEIPEGQSASYERGWEEFYFVPMRAHFAHG